MSSDDSVARLIEEIKARNEDAAKVLWDRYFPQLVEVARRKLASHRTPAENEEDIALSVMKSFFIAAGQDRFPELQDQDGLWRLLSKMTYRKTVDLIRKNSRDKRAGLGESGIHPGRRESDGNGRGFDGFPGRDQWPGVDLVLQEMLDELEPEFQRIAIMKMDDHTNKEIARDRGCSEPTIERRLNLIRKKWRAHTSS